MVPYGNMETSTPHSSETSQVITVKLCAFDYEHTCQVWLEFGFFLPFFVRTCTGQTDRENFTHSGSRDAVRRKEVPSQQVFFSHLTF